MNDSQSDGAAPASATPDTLAVHTHARQLLEWLIPALAKFPREQRHTVTRHMADLAMQVHDALIAARHQSPAGRAQCLREADTALDQLRQYALLACQWRWWSEGQYGHFSRLSLQLGRLVGGWRRAASAGGQFRR